ncbi:Ribosomal RNA small subunit methyltransferase E [Buchnera aphidicola (Cinara kochiana kochiana)]|uniref:Ribosomal RNA small subunit methyltransferase E n=1 Tax=Buchnera aphidicola (Cinara kochiana kochiana) TaxID=2518976 RepID=A0A451D637_9GAMM|nr:16S rRNA (uracil(1498)-N(3))-methyltransferase [Buchnera aphidicola]VFP81174.1 Ribosomal RNA small subunit methyltransferase E [Buchnera aphidicola (Cinara kochiana kochiana)]
MYVPRIYCNQLIKINTIIPLKKNTIHYCINVIRLQAGDLIHIFNNTNNIFISKILDINKNNIFIKIIKKKKENKESPTNIHLGQCYSKRMKFTIEKSVELGIKSITPIIINKPSIITKISKKICYWNKLIISACMQSQRNIIPKLNTPSTIYQWCNSIPQKSTKIIFNIDAKKNICDVSNKYNNIYILIGSEKGFNNNETKYTKEKKFLNVKLGPRILRTETASIVAIAALQVHLGDI